MTELVIQGTDTSLQVKCGVHRFMEYRFLQIVIANARFHILQIENKEVPIALCKGGQISFVDYNM